MHIRCHMYSIYLVQTVLFCFCCGVSLRVCVCVCVCACVSLCADPSEDVFERVSTCLMSVDLSKGTRIPYGVATISRLLKTIGLFCRILSLL